jgi:hypothetical protein
MSRVYWQCLEDFCCAVLMLLTYFPSCYCLCIPPILTSHCRNQSLWNLICASIIMAPERIWTVYFINVSHQCVCLNVYVARQRLDKTVTAATNTHATLKELLDSSFFAVRVVWKSLWLCLCIPLSSLGNGSANMFPLQRGVGRGVVLYAVRVVLKDSRRSVLPSDNILVKLGSDVALLMLDEISP